MQCSAKVKKGKMLIQRMKEKRENSRSRIEKLKKPIRDHHYNDFINTLNEDS